MGMAIQSSLAWVTITWVVPGLRREKRVIEGASDAQPGFALSFYVTWVVNIFLCLEG